MGGREIICVGFYVHVSFFFFLFHISHVFISSFASDHLFHIMPLLPGYDTIQCNVVQWVCH